MRILFLLVTFLIIFVLLLSGCTTQKNTQNNAISANQQTPVPVKTSTTIDNKGDSTVKCRSVYHVQPDGTMKLVQECGDPTPIPTASNLDLLKYIDTSGKGAQKFSAIYNYLEWGEYKAANDGASDLSLYYQKEWIRINKIPVSGELSQIQIKYLDALENYRYAASNLGNAASYANNNQWKYYESYLDKAEERLINADSDMVEVRTLINQLSSTPQSVSTPQSTNQNSCSFVGSYNWVRGKYTLTIYSGGTATSRDINGKISYAKWVPSQDGEHIVITWSDGWKDTVGLSNNCNSLDGYNSEGASVHGTRIE